MLSRALFGRRRRAGPKGHRAYAVGDVHGRLDLLDEILGKIEADIAARAVAKTSIVFLGDLIDRGPQSAQVVERLRLYASEGVRMLYIAGNHEEAMLRVLGGDMALLGDWLKFGGAECVQSYGIDPDRLEHASAAEALALIRNVVPQDHVDFLQSFADTVSFGSYLFVHAGIRPGIRLAEQSQQDLRWIRGEFLDYRRDHGFVVVHGHTIMAQVDERPNRIGIDTGAYRTGILTALAIEETERWLLQTGDVIGSEAEGNRIPKNSGERVLAGS